MKTSPLARLKIVIFYVSCGMSLACTVKKETALNRQLHSFTAKYNGLFHARALLQHHEAQLRHEPPFHRHSPLPLYPIPTQPSTDQPVLDQVIAKAQRLITQKRYSQYTAEAYLLLAKAYSFKGQYFLAEAYFRQVALTENAQPLLLAEALSGSLRTALQLKQPQLAQTLADSLKAYLPALKTVSPALYISLAQHHIHIQQYSQAIVYLEHALVTKPRHPQQDLWHYVCGQLYEYQHQYPQALSHYSKVKNPPAIYYYASRQAAPAATAQGSRQPAALPATLPDPDLQRPDTATAPAGPSLQQFLDMADTQVHLRPQLKEIDAKQLIYIGNFSNFGQVNEQDVANQRLFHRLVNQTKPLAISE